MATAPIRTSTEITTILNKGQHTLADLGYSIVGDAKRGQDLTEVDFRDKVYRLILLYTYLELVIDPDTGNPKFYWSSSTNKIAFNNLLNAIVALSDPYTQAGGIPLITNRGGTLIYYPSSSGPSGGGQSQSGGPANPGGVTFQNVSVSSPGEVVDVMDATQNDYAFYIVRIAGTGAGEGNRLDILGVNWRGNNTPVVTIYRGDAVGGSVPNTVTYSAAIVDGQMQLTAVVPTDGWSVKGTRISFENISFQNAQGPLPTGGTVGQYLRKSSSTDFDAAFATILMSEVSGLATALANRLLLAGGTMTGAIAMGSNKITGLANGVDAGDAVNKGQLDAVETKADTAQSDIDTHTARTDNPHSVTKSQVGLGNVDNTSDADKPISTATQSALDQKANGGNLNWTGFTYLNSWADASGLRPGGYAKDGLGFVHFRGGPSGIGASADVIATLPAGFRPVQSFFIYVIANFGGVLTNQALTIDTSGNITADRSGGVYSLDNISFPTT